MKTTRHIEERVNIGECGTSCGSASADIETDEIVEEREGSRGKSFSKTFTEKSQGYRTDTQIFGETVLRRVFLYSGKPHSEIFPFSKILECWLANNEVVKQPSGKKTSHHVRQCICFLIFMFQEEFSALDNCYIYH